MNPGETTAGGQDDRSDSPDHADAAQRKSAADERQTRADERETLLAAREERIDALDALRTDRTTRREGILADASDRDDDADSRDVIADDRDRAASLQAFLHDEEFDVSNKARRAAARDRSDSKADRASAAADRSELAADDAGA